MLDRKPLARIGWALALAVAAGASACSSDVTIGTAPPPQGGPLEPTATHAEAITKVDLLFVIDNSSSMGPKQRALGKRIPEMLRLLTQIGVDPVDRGAPKITDLHVAVITSSLGSQGTSACAKSVHGRHVDDAAHLLPRAGEAPSQGYRYDPSSGTARPVACPALRAAAPIRWVADAASDPSAELRGADDLPTLEAAVTCTVLSADEQGCGYEMPLEAMYRFLADPAPPLSVGVRCRTSQLGEVCSGEIEHDGLDTELLAQRAAFLRPDSLLAIVLLTDENDSSLRAEGSNWLPWALAPGTMVRAQPGCAALPDDVTDPSGYGCGACLSTHTEDSRACQVPWPAPQANADVDALSLRGFHQVQRFGADFLFPVSRYVDALGSGTVRAWDGTPRPNPIFAGGRARDQIVLAGIVGAPPALVSDASGRPRPLDEADWAKLVSRDPGARDPHMIESIAPRADVPRFEGDPETDPVNGGDRDVPLGDDLQYACLGEPLSKGEEKVAECESRAAGEPAKNPACLDGQMVRLRAYPSIRPLRVIHELGAGGVVASICERSYRGAVAGIAEKIGHRCAATSPPPALR